MTLHPCSECGAIKESASITLHRLKDKINNKINVLKFSTTDSEGKGGKITDLELWEWTEAIKRALGEL